MTTNAHTFETMTDEIKYMFQNEDGDLEQVSSHDEGMSKVKQALWEGKVTRTFAIVGWYVKQVYGMSRTGEWMYSYRLVWRDYIPS